MSTLLSLAMVTCASADTITFVGTGIALRGCRIQAIQGGQVSYSDPSGQRQRRPLSQIEALGFDGLPQLDQAETAIADEDLDAGLWALLRALLSAETELQRLWLHARLSQIHDLRGEYVQAAGHAAEVFTLSDDVSWKSLRPVSAVNTPTYAAANEALENLQNAARRVKSAELQREVEIMTRLVQGVETKLAAENTGPAIERGSTISGFDRAVVLANAQLPKPGATPATATPSTAAAPPTPAVTTPSVAAEDSNDPRSAAAIDRLLAGGRTAEAVSLCADIEKNPGERDLAHFLYQYGKALAQANRTGEAAVMLTRCAILYPDSDDAGAALIETAVLYRDQYKNPATARRLLLQAIADAERNERTAIVMLAREVLATLPQS